MIKKTAASAAIECLLDRQAFKVKPILFQAFAIKQKGENIYCLFKCFIGRRIDLKSLMLTFCVEAVPATSPHLHAIETARSNSQHYSFWEIASSSGAEP
jgi:hypothetical protein